MSEELNRIDTISSSRILFSPLNWGLGHVSRSVPIIRKLLKNNNEVFLFCDEQQQDFYRFFFPDIPFIAHSGYPFKFGGKGKWVFDIARHFSELNRFIKEEKTKVDHYVNIYKPDLIISDQRFGFVSSQTRSVIISHQLNLPVKRFNVIAHQLNHRFLAAFEEVWIPDTVQQSYSGKLSNGNFKNKHFIGLCSRFQKADDTTTSHASFRFLGIVSGPFPYNRQFFNLLLEKMAESSGKNAIILPHYLFDKTLKIPENICLFRSPSPDVFNDVLQESEQVVSRSGYSTLMDLAVLNKPAILVPTPGQSEQLYLADFHKKHTKWQFERERNFTLSDRGIGI